MGPEARWVLVSEGRSGRSRAALAAVRSLAAGGYRPTVTVSGELSLAARSRSSARVVSVPAAGGPGYRVAIEAELETRDYVTVIPCSDHALAALEHPGHELLDKSSWPDAARAAGLSVPPTTRFNDRDDLLSAAGSLDFPIVVKPTTKRFLARRFSSATELQAATIEGRVLVQPYLDDRMMAVVGVMWDGHLVAAVHQRYERVWPDPCGTVSSAVTIEPDPSLEQKIETFLSDYSGLFHMEFAGTHLLDVNPRAHALNRLAAAAGCDLVVTYCDLVSGRSPRPERKRGRAGVFFRWVEGDLRSIRSRLKRRALTLSGAVAAARPRLGAVHSFETFKDPRPFVEDLRFSLKNARG